MTETDLQLLARYTRDHAEDAFAEIVGRHLNLVHSAALRQVRSPQLAEEVAQSAFTDLARNAGKLKPDTILTAWLYQVTRRTAIDVVRREARRQLREQIATELNAMNATTADWTHIEPLLDEAMHALDDTDRAAVLLRYFENKSLREVGQSLGTSDDAAQKRVSRAVERLREFFAKRGVTVGASGLVVVISANAVQAAPIGLAVTISTAALAGTVVSTSTIIAVGKTTVMTTLQKSLIAGTILAAALVSTVLLVQRPNTMPSVHANPSRLTNSPLAAPARSTSAFWRRFDKSHLAHNLALSSDAKLQASLARLRVALYAPPVSGEPRQDPAAQILYDIPLEQRAAALDQVMQALRDPNQHVCRRAISLIPMIWPQGEAAHPVLFDLVRTKSSDWPGVTGEALIAAVQVHSEADVIPELVLAAMQGGVQSQREFATQLPILTAQIKDSGGIFAANLQPFLNSLDADVRLTAAQALAQLPGPKDKTVAAELAASLSVSDGSRASEERIRASLGAIMKMGVEAQGTVPALLALAEGRPELTDLAGMVLKAVAPEALKGVGVATPLPPHAGTSQAISQSLATGAWTVQNAIDALKTPELLLPTARALADYGSEAAAALPALREALEATAITNFNSAIVLASVIERLDPEQPKPLLLAWDFLPALNGVVAAAEQYQITGLDNTFDSLRDRISTGFTLNHNDVRRFSTALGQLDPRLQQVFQAKLLEADSKFAALFQNITNR